MADRPHLCCSNFSRRPGDGEQLSATLEFRTTIETSNQTPRPCEAALVAATRRAAPSYLFRATASSTGVRLAITRGETGSAERGGACSLT